MVGIFKCEPSFSIWFIFSANRTSGVSCWQDYTLLNFVISSSVICTVPRHMQWA